jgi:RNA polymerase sigma-70 factor (ECF subfamily)
LENENTNYVTYLIELSQAGRKNAFFDLCKISLRNVFTVAYRLYPDYDKAQRITLRTFLIVWENIKTFDPKKSFMLWLKNVTIKLVLKELMNSGVSLNPIKAKTIYAHDNERIENMIMNLPNEDRIIFVLHDIEGYDYDEMKDFLENLTVDEIKSKLLDIRKQLIINLGL